MSPLDLRPLPPTRNWVYDALLLVVEDDPVQRHVLQQQLQPLFRHVDFAPTGLQALTRYYVERPDIVLIDLHMPGLDGIEAIGVMRRLQAEMAAPPLHIVVLTCDISATARRRAMAAGANLVALKPCPRDALLAALTSPALRRRA